MKRRLGYLREGFREDEWESKRRALPDFFKVAYRPATLRQILYLRKVLRWQGSDVDCMVTALILGCLHGESARSPSFLSNQMPHTISTKPAYSVRFWLERGLQAPKRDVFDLLNRHALYRYQSPVPRSRADIFKLDMRDLPRIKLPREIRCVVTSPPYFDVTSYQEDQWLRLWFLGGPTRPATTRREERTADGTVYWRLVGDMWRVLGLILAPKANVVVRIGAVRYAPEMLAKQLTGSALSSNRRVRLANYEVSAIKRRQTDSFRPGAQGCSVEVDCHFTMN